MTNPGNRCKVFTATTGTGSSVVLGAAVSNFFLTPAESGMIDAQSYYYVIEQGTDFEEQQGVYTASGTTIARNTPLRSKINGTVGTTKITLDGTAVVYFPISKEVLDNIDVIDGGTF